MKGEICVGDSVGLIVEPMGIRVAAPKDAQLLAFLRKIGIELPSICGGLGTCGKCVVRVLEGLKNLNALTESEGRLLPSGHLREGYRLACMTRLIGNARIMIPLESLPSKPRLQVEGLEAMVGLDPAVSEVLLRVPAPTLLDVRSDYKRLADALSGQGGSDSVAPSLEELRLLPFKARRYGWKFCLVLWKRRRVLEVLSPKSRRKLCGVAVDIGTTKLAAYLLDLRTGKTMGVASTINPQVAFGEDVIARIAYARERGGLLRLQEAVLWGINEIIGECCLKAGVKPRDLYEVVAVGNTAMHHLLLGISPKTLGFAPYVPVVQEPLDLPARRLRLKANKEANLHLLPVVAGFVGADAVADVLATGLHEAEEPGMIFDIGTNTEVVLGNKEGMICASCASGPAFEGAGIKFGMRAADGAIERVDVDPKTLKVSYRVIGGVKPRGLCGSGIIDAIAGLVKAGALDSSGRMKAEADLPGFRTGSGGQREFLIAPAEESAVGADVVVTQGDVREIQLAKAAVLTGAEILMGEANIEPSQIQGVFLAGAFGTHVCPESALALGMIPSFEVRRIQSVGNAAGSGAKLALLSVKLRAKAEEIAEKMRYVELHTYPGFQGTYFKALAFPASL